MFDSWREIGATLSRNKTRTFLTAFGIFWGTTMLALLWGSSKGLQYLMMSNFEGFATNCAVMFPNRTTMPYRGFQKGMTWSMTMSDVDNVRNIVPELKTVSPISSKGATFKYKDKTYSGQVQGNQPNYADVLSPRIVAGRYITEADISKTSKVCVIGTDAVNNLFGTEDPMGKFVECDNIYYKVVGVVKKNTDITFNGDPEQMLFIPLSSYSRSYNTGNNIGFMAIVAKDEYKLGDLRPKIDRALRIEHPLHPDDENCLHFIDISDMFDQVTSIFTGLDLLMLFVGLSSLIAGIIGVGNIMWIMVKERTKEFGIRRALGAKPRMVMTQIMQESAILTTVAGTAGICFAVLVLGVVNNIIPAASDTFTPAQVQFQLSFGAAIAILVLFLVLGGAASSIPAFKAMGIKPIEAMNDK